MGPPDSLETRPYFTESMFREFAAFLVDKYESTVIDAGRTVNDDTIMGALQVSSTIFLVLTQEYPALRNAQRYISYLMRVGFTQDQIRIVVNRYSKKSSPNYASLEQIQQTLNQPVFYGIPESGAVLSSINKGRPMVADRAAAGDADRIFRAFVDKATIGKKAEAQTA